MVLLTGVSTVRRNRLKPACTGVVIEADVGDRHALGELRLDPVEGRDPAPGQVRAVAGPEEPLTRSTGRAPSYAGRLALVDVDGAADEAEFLAEASWSSRRALTPRGGHGSIRPVFTAYRVSSTRPRIPSFSRMFARWRSTVFGLIVKMSAIC